MAPAGWLLPLLAGITSAVFTGFVVTQYARGRRAHQLAWALGLAAYAGASFLEAYADALGWSVPAYRAYFPLAAGTVGLLGLGTLLLVLPRAGATLAVGLVGTLLLLAALGQLLVPLSPEALSGPAAEVGARPIPFPNPGRIAFLVLNVAGGLALIGGAAWSWWRTRRAGVLLIALGALLPFAGGSLSTLFGVHARIALQLLGIVVMFAGYLQGREATRGPGHVAAPARG